MKQKLPISLLLTAAIASVAPIACAQDEAGDTTIATINGQNYTLDLFRTFYTQRLRETNSQNDQPFQERAFNEFLSVVVAAQEGEKRDLASNPEVQAALELQRLMILSNAALQSIASEEPVTEDELKEAYERFKEQAKRTEYKARHILVDEQEKAEALIKQLDDAGVEGFAELAKENSLGPTADKGGDLGWFDPRQMVKPFADALTGLEPGSYTKQPVQTQFGWHVILLEETRTAEPPSFEDAKPSLEAAVKRQKTAEALAKLRQDAKVELNEDVVKLKDDEGDQEE